MKILYSAELESAALQAFNEVSTEVGAFLRAGIENSSLRNLDIDIFYVPIIMGESRKARFRARSRVTFKFRRFNCCPQLDVNIFATGTKSEVLVEFIRGLRECSPALVKLGAAREQALEFDSLLEETIVALARN